MSRTSISPTPSSRRSRAALSAVRRAEPAAPAAQRAVFFDRDGTLNEEIGHMSDLRHFRVYPFAAEAVRLVNQAGLLAIVLTNQAGVGKGLFQESLVEEAHRRLTRRIQAGGGRLDAIFYCPHHPDASVEEYRVTCLCRKPAPGMAATAAAQFGIDLAKSFVVGDRFVDVELARQVGARSVLVLTGFGRNEWEAQRVTGAGLPDYVAKDARDAVRWILRHL